MHASTFLLYLEDSTSVALEHREQPFNNLDRLQTDQSVLERRDRSLIPCDSNDSSP